MHGCLPCCRTRADSCSAAGRPRRRAAPQSLCEQAADDIDDSFEPSFAAHAAPANNTQMRKAGAATPKFGQRATGTSKSAPIKRRPPKPADNRATASPTGATGKRAATSQLAIPAVKQHASKVELSPIETPYDDPFDCTMAAIGGDGSPERIEDDTTPTPNPKDLAPPPTSARGKDAGKLPASGKRATPVSTSKAKKAAAKRAPGVAAVARQQQVVQVHHVSQVQIGSEQAGSVVAYASKSPLDLKPQGKPGGTKASSEPVAKRACNTATPAQPAAKRGIPESAARATPDADDMHTDLPQPQTAADCSATAAIANAVPKHGAEAARPTQSAMATGTMVPGGFAPSAGPSDILACMSAMAAGGMAIEQPDQATLMATWKLFQILQQGAAAGGSMSHMLAGCAAACSFFSLLYTLLLLNLEGQLTLSLTYYVSRVAWRNSSTYIMYEV